MASREIVRLELGIFAGLCLIGLVLHWIYAGMPLDPLSGILLGFEALVCLGLGFWFKKRLERRPW